ncbi:hypothetical protein NSK_001388 [Nannochloropsis salina CCMP1776]|uniref:PDZ domain-containing protein n=1 Tax=Nannochloropsis salina CCMP1776 TaxID=1027361 RepID=A0A4D9D7Q5_9STRA|nr:hypothetical protein NSK_001388 [Nannochloropsis salina CCMP1776]|eukprot:TFJ87054.1 hypothetical protein NSK_001388 [Nannochloropsis salina CCMP1776]
MLLGYAYEDSTARADAKPLPPKGSAHGNGLGRYFVADAVEAAAPAVANITVNIRFHAGRWTPTYATQSGSGFVISEDGLVVTNAHVIASSVGGDEPVMITLTDGRKFSGKVHSIDARTDVALLQADTQGAKLPVARIGQSSNLRPGEWVVALGSPQGLANTVTVGIVSTVARLGSELGLMHTRAEYIQTDAAINAGNSGGPLVNLDGEVVGINSMKLEYSDGIGFAIPIDSAFQVVQQLIKYKRVRRPYVGLSFRLVNVEGAEGERVGEKELGMLVLEVKAGSPAEKAGLQEGDVVIEIDGSRVKGLGDVTEKIGLEPEKTFTVKVIRHGQRHPLMMSVTSVADERKG